MLQKKTIICTYHFINLSTNVALFMARVISCINDSPVVRMARSCSHFPHETKLISTVLVSKKSATLRPSHVYSQVELKCQQSVCNPNSTGWHHLRKIDIHKEKARVSSPHLSIETEIIPPMLLQPPHPGSTARQIHGEIAPCIWLHCITCSRNTIAPTTDDVPTTAATRILDDRGRWRKPTKKTAHITPAACNNQYLSIPIIIILLL